MVDELLSALTSIINKGLYLLSRSHSHQINRLVMLGLILKFDDYILYIGVAENSHIQIVE
jgi:hypothetical protein